MNAQIDITKTTLKTDRILLRNFKESDLDDFYNYAKVDGVGEHAGWHHHENIDETKKILNMFIEEKKTFALVYNNKVIGSLGIEKYNEEKNPELSNLKGREIGLVISKEYQGLGIGTEVINEVLKYLFNELKLDFVIAAYYEFNIRSKRLQEKCGFRYYKEYLDDYFGKEVRHIENIILKEDFK